MSLFATALNCTAGMCNCCAQCAPKSKELYTNPLEVVSETTLPLMLQLIAVPYMMTLT